MKALFRGKRIDNGLWVEGYYVRDSAANLGIDDVPLSAARVCNVIVENGTMWHVHPQTVGQYTGLDDSEGNKLFSGQEIVVRDYVDRGDGSKDDDIARVHFEDGAYIAHGLDYMCFIIEEYDWLVIHDEETV